jgi:hypothetical protein
MYFQRWTVFNDLYSNQQYQQKNLQLALDSLATSNYYSLVYYRLILRGDSYSQIQNSMLISEGNLGILFPPQEKGGRK